MHNLLKPLAHVSCSQCHQRCAGMFCNFSPQTFADFTAIGRSLSLPSGSVLMRESDRCEQIYSICSGHVKLSCLSKIGQTLNLKIAFPGEVLGLGAAISAAKVELTAETMVPTVVKVIRRDEFLAFVNSHGEVSRLRRKLWRKSTKQHFPGHAV